MSKSLVIVESPAKAKTINKYLGNDFIVKSSIGHIRDLPTGGQGEVDTKARAEQAARTRKMSDAEKVVYKKKKAGEQLVSRMGIDPENGWKARYEILPGKEKVIDELRKLAKTADVIYLATDLDREGEAIAWHLREAIGGAPERYRRVVFNEITKKAIQQAFENPGQVDMDKVSAQQARRFLDRVVGFMVSPLLWAKVARGLSAGRVQSVSVRLIVEREAAIRAFIPDEYWEVDADLKTPKGATVPFSVKKIGDKPFRPVNQAGADAAVAAIKGAPLVVTNREDKPTSTKPLAPFITSTLQQAGSNRLGFSVKKTMMLAQRLYEAGYITYMRTDSTNLSADAVEACRTYIDKNYGKKYLPQKPNSYSSKENAQEAHEAVRPSNVALAAKDLVGMEPDALRVYQLIWQQFVACQMVPAEFTSTRVDIKVGEYELRTSGRVVVFDGFQRVLPPVVKQDEDRELPDMRVNDRMSLVSITPSQHFTNPPPRFTEASLVKEMEKRGIGRPSTYAAIISTIQERGYVALKNRRFYAEKMGDIVTERLTESFSDLMDYGFTAGMEETLDEIASGKKSWKGELDRFYRGFTKQLEKAQGAKGGMRENNPVDTDIPCPSCGRIMQIRTGSTGVFLGCSGYGLPPKERCKSTINLVPGEEAITNARNDEEAETLSLKSKHRCKLCNTAMDSYLIDETRKLHICGRNPDCAGVEVEQGSYRLKGYEGPIVECDKCGSNMQLKNGRFGKYFGCTNEACRNTRKLMRNGEAAPPKMDVVPMPELRCNKVDDHYLLRDGASGLFLAASQFPKNREIRAPLVSELLPHRKEIDPKYAYLFDAPQKDPQGNSAVVRFSRKAQQQYVQTELDGKPTGWRATYRDGRWVAEQGPAGKDDDAPAPRATKSATAAVKTPAKPKAKTVAKAKAAAKPKAKAKPKR